MHPNITFVQIHYDYLHLGQQLLSKLIPKFPIHVSNKRSFERDTYVNETIFLLFLQEQ